MAAATEEKPCRETSGVTVYSSKISATKSSTPCADRSCSSIVTSGIGVAFGIGHDTLPFASPEVKSDVRQGEERAMGERLGRLADETEESGGCTQNCTHAWYETARGGTKAVVSSIRRDVPILLNKMTRYDVVLEHPAATVNRRSVEWSP